MNLTLNSFFKFLLLGMLFSHGSAFSKDGIKISMHPRINQPGQVEVLVSLTNTTKETISILKDELPWEQSSAMTLFITDTLGDSLKQIFPIADPDFNDIIKIKGGIHCLGK